MVGPWDEIPTDANDFLDYRGVARPEDLRVAPWSFPLGRYVLPHSSRRQTEWVGEHEFGLTSETANKHSVVYAPTQFGKTTSVIAPWIYSALRQGYLVVALDLKGNGDLLSKVESYEATQEPLLDLAITNLDYTHPGQSEHWNWIADLVDDSAIDAAATALVGKDRDNDPNREFRLRDLKWMRGLLEFVHDSGKPWTIETILRLLDDHERFVRLISNTAPPRAQSRLSDLVYLPAEEYYTKVQFVTTFLEVLNTPGWNFVTSRRGLAIEALVDEPGLVVVSAPLADGKLSEAVSSLFLSQFLNVQARRFNTASRPVLLVLDEAPRLQERLDLPRLMSTTASSGMSVLLALQEVTDLNEDGRKTILANCATHILMGGAGPDTTGYFADRLGKRIVSNKTHSTTYTAQAGRSFQVGVQSSEVDVLGRNELVAAPGGPFSAVVHSYDLSRKPILVDFTRRDLLP
ncbi:MAG TPA: TraM recognition domain-containing protein [Kribbella sp.]